MWLAQSFVELDQEETQKILDAVQTIIKQAQDFKGLLDEEQSELARITGIHPTGRQKKQAVD